MKAEDLALFYGVPALIQLSQPLYIAAPTGMVVEVMNDGEVEKYAALRPAFYTTKDGDKENVVPHTSNVISGTLHEAGEESCLLNLRASIQEVELEFKVLLPISNLMYVTVLPDPPIEQKKEQRVSLS